MTYVRLFVMGTLKCCVGGCNATSETHRLFCFPKNDKLRNLWMSFIVPTNSLLIGLSKELVLRKRVCEKHFDKHQFDHEGKRLRYSYPCLLRDEEITHGVPLSVAGWDVTLEHNYFKEQDEEDVSEPLPVTTTTGCDVSIKYNYFKDQDNDSVTKSSVVIGSADKLNSEETGNTMTTTAEVVEFFDQLFDSINGYPGGAKRGKLRRAVKKNSPHLSFWIEAIKEIKSLNFIDKISKHAVQSGKPRIVKVPSLQGWITTLESFVRISKLLFDKYSVDYYYPRHMNQDPLENFFGRIRALNYRNVNPDSNTFLYAFKSLLISNVLSPHSKYSNCEEDDGDALLNVRCLFENENVGKENYIRGDDTELPSSSQDTKLPSSSQKFTTEIFSINQVILEKVKVHCSAYTAGYVCRKISKAIKCKACLHTYTSRPDENLHKYIQFREYKCLKNNNLVYPSEKLLILYRDVASLIHSYLNVNCFKNNLKSNLQKRILSTMRYSWLGCAKHNKLHSTQLVQRYK